jgi:hypothetical protein
MPRRPWTLAFPPILLLTLLLAQPARADWAATGNVVADGAVDEDAGVGVQSFNTTIAPDPSGGCFVAYFFSNDSIRINRLSGDTGAKLWGPTGILVNIGGNAASQAVVEPDGAGGCWVAWLDQRVSPPAIFFQRYDANGVTKSADGGFGAVAPVAGTQIVTYAIADGPSSKLHVAYWETGGEPLKVVTVNMPGNGFLPSVTVPSVMTSDQGSVSSGSGLHLLADGAGGGFVVWPSNRAALPGNGGYSRIVANRFDSFDAPLWGTQGAVVQAGAGVTASQLRAFWDGTHLFVCWKHDAATDGIHAQQLDGSGVAQWGSTATGVTVMDQLNTAWDDWVLTDMQPRIAPAASDGCWVGWVDGRDFNRPAPNGFNHAQDLYVQRLNSSGTRQLATNGAPLDTMPGTSRELQACAGASGELLVVYKSLLYDQGDIIVARVNTSGAVVPSNDIVNKTGNPAVDDDVQEQPGIVPDGFGGVFMVWDDNRADPNRDVYATHRTSTLGTGGSTITLTAPNGGQTFVPLESTNITWTSTLSAVINVKLEYAHAGMPRQTIVTATPNDGAFTWNMPADGGSDLRVYVSEQGDGAPQDSSDAPFTICALGGPASTRMHDAPAWTAQGDFDADGLPDLAIAINGGVQVLRSLGGGAFDSLASEPLGSVANGVCTADFNEDGALDLAVATNSGLFVLPGELASGVPTATFGPPASLLGGQIRSVEAADFNADGVFDLAAVTVSNVQVFLGNGAAGVGDGTFAAPVAYGAGGTPLYFTIADLNEDSIWDLAVANNQLVSNSVSILLGNGSGGVGDGTFAPAVNYTAGTNPRLVVTGDFNEDGITDLAVGANTATGVSILLGQGASGVGNGTFGAATAYPFGINARDLEVGDFNGDGRADLAVAASTGGLQLLYGDGTGSVGDGTFTVGDSLSPGTLSALEANNWVAGTAIDVAVAESGVSADRLWVFSGGCPPTAPQVTLVAPNGGEFRQLAQKLEIQWTKSASVMAVHVEVSRDGGARWERIASDVTDTQLAWTVTGPSTTQALVRVVDANRFDVSDASHGAFTIATGAIMVLAPNGGETLRSFEPAEIRWVSSLGGTVKLEYAVNHGAPVLITGSTANDGTFSWIVPNVVSGDVEVLVSSGAVLDSSDAAFGICPRLLAGTDYAAGSFPGPIVTGDFNEDDIADLAVKAQNQLRVLLGQGAAGVGDGAFAAGVTVASSASIAGLAAGDFNEDGIADLVATAGPGLLVHFGTGAGGVGDGGFGAGTDVAPGVSTSGVAVADLDEDGILDLVATTSADQLMVLLGNGTAGVGDGTFGAPTFYATSSQPNELAVADFDENGIWDVAVSCRNGNNVTIFLGNGTGGVGDGTFAAGVGYPTPSHNDELVVADFDNDGILDLVTAQHATNALRFLRGNGTGGVGDGTFAAADPFTIPSSNILEVAVADFDFDDSADLLITGEDSLGDSQELLVLLNTGAGNFASRGSVVVGDDPVAVALGDFNEDGVFDVALSRATAGMVTVLLGNACGLDPSGSVSLIEPGPGPARPQGGEAVATTDWAVGSDHTIAWTKTGHVLAVDVQVSRDNGASWETVARGLYGDSFTWTVTPPLTDQLVLRVSDALRPGTSDASDAPIRVVSSTTAAGSELPGAASFSRAWPNPARGDVRFELALPRESDVTVQAFDVNGRLVATLAEGRLPAGYHQVRWGSTAGRDAATPAGIYFVRARWEGFHAVRRVVRVQ